MSIDPVVNFGKVTASTGYDQSAVSIALSAGHGARLPNPGSDGAFNLVWFNSTDYSDPTDDPNREIVRCIARSTDTLTITRAQEGTSASTKNSAGRVYLLVLAVTAKTITDIKAAINAIPAAATWAKETPNGLIDGINLVYTLVNIPIAKSGDLMLNGQPFSEGTDYTVNTALKQITMSTPIPLVAEALPFIFKYQF